MWATMMTLLGVSWFLCSIAIVRASIEEASYLDQHLHVLLRLHGAYTNESRMGIDARFLKFVMELHDDDAKCDDEHCEAQLAKFLGSTGSSSGSTGSSPGENSITWDRFRALLEKIYPAGAISTDPYEPQEIHLSLTGASAVGREQASADMSMKMKVMWVTMSPLEQPVVQYLPKAADEEEYDWTTSSVGAGVTSTYTVPKKWWPIFTGVIYDADMSALLPGASYVYRVGGYSPANATYRFSGVHDFTAPPLPFADRDRPTTVAALADQGTFEFFGFAVVNKMAEMRAELGLEMVMVAGDLSYAGLSSAFPPLNITSEDEFEHIWDLLFIQNQVLGANLPWMSGNGNHERFYNWSAFTHRYQMPQSVALADPASVSEGQPSNGNFWYSYIFGNQRWISISSEHSLDAGSPQMLYLTAALSQAKRERDAVPWVIVTIHKPLYCSDLDTPGGYADKLEDTFVKFDVDLVVAGHLHVYERISPVYKTSVTCPPVAAAAPAGGPEDSIDAYFSEGKGPVYVVQGNAGAMQFDRWVMPQPAWSAFRMSNGLSPQVSSPASAASAAAARLSSSRDHEYQYTDTYGFGVVGTSNSTHLLYKSIPITGTFTDTFWIVKHQK